MSTSEQLPTSVAAEEFKIVKDGVLHAVFGIHPESMQPLLTFYEKGMPAVRLGLGFGHALLELRDVDSGLRIALGKHRDGYLEVVIEGTAGPGIRMGLDQAGGCSFVVHGTDPVPIFSVVTQKPALKKPRRKVPKPRHRGTSK